MKLSFKCINDQQKPKSKHKTNKNCLAKGKTISCYPVKRRDKHSTNLSLLLDPLVKQQVINFPDPRLPYEVHTDASAEGLGAVFYQ